MFGLDSNPGKHRLVHSELSPSERRISRVFAPGVLRFEDHFPVLDLSEPRDAEGNRLYADEAVRLLGKTTAREDGLAYIDTELSLLPPGHTNFHFTPAEREAFLDNVRPSIEALYTRLGVQTRE